MIVKKKKVRNFRLNKVFSKFENELYIKKERNQLEDK